MAIDIYTTCPCGSGKKIKFCCGDLAADIERVVRMIQGDQRVAALQLLNKLLGKHPERVTLLDLKASIVLTMSEWDQATKIVDRILELQPKHVPSLARRAILHAIENDPEQAIPLVQQAVEYHNDAIEGDLLEAFYMVGVALIDAGKIIAAKAHLRQHWMTQLQSGISPSDQEFDSRAIKELVRLHIDGDLPLLLKDDFLLRKCPEDVAWSSQFEEAMERARIGAWRTAADRFRDLIPISEHHPTVIYNTALIEGWLGDTRGLIDGLREYAHLDVPVDDAVEALARARLLDSGCPEDAIDCIEHAYEIHDPDRINAILSDHPQALALQENEWFDADVSERGGISPPIAEFAFLNRPMPVGRPDIAREEMPIIRTVLILHGRGTDRSGQLRFVLPRNPDYEDTLAQLKTICGDALGASQKEEIVGTIDRVYDRLALRWRVPDEFTGKRLVELRNEQRYHALVNIWPTIPQYLLGGKTPDEAAADPECRIPLLAALLILETTSLAAGARSTIQDLRQRLGMGPVERIDPATIDRDQLPFARMMRLDTKALDDLQLIHLYQQARTASAEHALVHLAREVVQRPHLRDRIDFFEAYEQLIRDAENVDDALAMIREARERTGGNPNSDSIWDLAECNVYFDAADPDNVQRMIHHIQTEHSDNANLQEALFRMLVARGLIQLPDPMDDSESGDVTEHSPDTEHERKIWIPDSAGAVQSSKDKPAIWTP